MAGRVLLPFHNSAEVMCHPSWCLHLAPDQPLSFRFAVLLCAPLILCAAEHNNKINSNNNNNKINNNNNYNKINKNNYYNKINNNNNNKINNNDNNIKNNI